MSNLEKVVLYLTQDEKDYLASEMNCILRQFNQEYNGKKFTNETMASAFAKLMMTLSPNQKIHENIQRGSDELKQNMVDYHNFCKITGRIKMSLIKTIDRSIKTLKDNMSIKYVGDIDSNNIKIVDVKNLDLLFLSEYLELKINETFKEKYSSVYSGLNIVSNVAVFCNDSNQIELLKEYFNSYFNSMMFSEYLKNSQVTHKSKIEIVNNELKFKFLINLDGTTDQYKFSLNIDLLLYKNKLSTGFYDYVAFLKSDKLNHKFVDIFKEGIYYTTKYILLGDTPSYYNLNTSYITLNNDYKRIVDTIIESEQDFIDSLYQEQTDGI